MIVYMIWGQLKCDYEGQHAPCLLEAIDEYSDEENPEWLTEKYQKYLKQKGEAYDDVIIVSSEIDDKEIRKLFEPQKIEMGSLEIV